MSQTVMLPIVEELNAAELARLERERLANLRWESWGRSIGLLTLEQINRNNHPNWAWDDYAI